MRFFRMLLVVFPLIVVHLGCGEPLPEYYGTYIQTGRDLINLQEVELGERVISGDSSIIVFDKGVAGTGFEHDGYVQLNKIQYLRWQVISYHAKASFSSFEDFRFDMFFGVDPTGEPILIRARPVSENEEMMEFKPVGEIHPGSYVLRVRSHSYFVHAGISVEERFTSKDPSCVDIRIWRSDLEMRLPSESFRELTTTGVLNEVRVPVGDGHVRAELWPCSKTEEVLNAARETIELPSYVNEPARSVMVDWLLTRPSLRLLEPEDCNCDEDLAAIRKVYENSNPYFVEEDFNGDGVRDLAVSLVNSESEHEWERELVIAIFNGPIEAPQSPAYYSDEVGTIHGALLFYRENDGLSVGKWESSTERLVPVDLSYTRE